MSISRHLENTMPGELRGPRMARDATEPAPVIGARWIALTQGKFALVDETDYASVSIKNWHYASGCPAYSINGYKIRMHTVLLPDAEGVDHINLNTLDNRRENLRAATPTENRRNRPLSSNNSS